jgi:hypothetical protein
MVAIESGATRMYRFQVLNRVKVSAWPSAIDIAPDIAGLLFQLGFYTHYLREKSTKFI